jgi:hypothetical protein
MRFTLAALVFMYVGRKLGWALSKRLLYTAGTGLVVVATIIWCALVALVIHGLIIEERPHWVLKIIFGFGLGAYVAVPNFGLIMESSIPEHAVPRHTLISTLPLWIFIAASVGLAFLR